jgi:hypothetical protein
MPQGRLDYSNGPLAAAQSWTIARAVKSWRPGTPEGREAQREPFAPADRFNRLRIPLY